jgi:hypothetical protein
VNVEEVLMPTAISTVFEVSPGDSAVLERCVWDAQHAVLSLWDRNAGTFWRSTAQRAREGDAKAFYPTVTLHCTALLLQLVRECPEWASPDTVALLLDEIVPSVSERKEEELNSSLDQNSRNIFTLSNYVYALAEILRSSRGHAGTKELLVLAVDDMIKQCENRSDLHPFLLFRVTKAAVAAFGFTEEPLRERLNALCAGIREKLRTAT